MGLRSSASRLAAARQELEFALKQKGYFQALSADADNTYRMEGRNHPKPELAISVKEKPEKVVPENFPELINAGNARDKAGARMHVSGRS